MESLTLRALRRDIDARLPAALTGVVPAPDGEGLALVTGFGVVVLDAGGTRPPVRLLPPPEAGARPGRNRAFEWTGHAAWHEVAWHLGTRGAGGRIVATGSNGLDRVLGLTLAQKDRFGDGRRTTLVVEIFGRFVNVLVLDGGFDGTILSRLRDDRRGAAGARIERGRRYEPPPRDRADLELDGEAAVAARLLAAQAAIADWPAALEKAAVGVGPFLAREVVARAGGPPARGLEPAEAARHAARIAAAWRELVRRVDEAPEPGLAGGRALPFRPESLPDWEPAESLAAAILRSDAARIATADVARPAAGPRIKLAAELAGRRARAAKRLDQLEAERVRHPDESGPRRFAQTLLALADRVPRGADRVTLPAVDGGGDLDIPLEPELSAIENADRWFKEARKARQAAERLPREIARAAREVERWTAFEARLAALAADDIPGVAALAGELDGRAGARRGATGSAAMERGAGRGGSASAGSRRRDEAPASMQPRRYRLPGGWTILVGRSNAANDYLTHRLAEPHDLWFHAHGCPGSHVVLKGPDRRAEPDRSVIEAAAALAALHSKARHAARVPVIYAEKRHVRKPRGSKPGLAAVTNEKSLMVRPGEPAETVEES
jgi:predicted ribosome quality control (RQC) complex YloA/Tae2 family protein